MSRSLIDRMTLPRRSDGTPQMLGQHSTSLETHLKPQLFMELDSEWTLIAEEEADTFNRRRQHLVSYVETWKHWTFISIDRSITIVKSRPLTVEIVRQSFVIIQLRRHTALLQPPV